MITRLFISIYRYFHAHKVLCWGLMLALFAFFGFFATRIHLEGDLNKMMPSSRNADGSIKLAFADLRIKDKMFLMVEAMPGTETERLTEVADAFVDSLSTQNAALDSVHQMVDDIFYKIPDDILTDGIDYMTQHLPAYIDESVYPRIDSLLNTEHMKLQMQKNRDDLLGVVGSVYPELIQMDPLGLRDILIGHVQQLTQGGGGTGGFKIIDNHFFVPDSTVCFVFITPKYTGGKADPLTEAMERNIAQFNAQNPDVKLSYHGTTASGYYNSHTIGSDLKGTVIGSLVLVLLFIFVCFRNWNTIPLLLLPVAFGALFGLALMYFIKGQFSLLALGIGAIVLGVALSYVLHVITHYKYVSNPEQVLREQVKPVLLGCITTIGSFMGLMFIRTDLLQDFGLFATFAIVGTTLFSLVFLPQLLSEKGNKRNQKAFAVIDGINAYPFHKKRILLGVIAIIALVAVGAYFMRGTQFDADMRNLGYHNEGQNYAEKLHRDKTYTGDKQQYFASQGATMEEALENFALMQQKLDSLKQAGLVKSFTPTCEIFVPMKVQQQRIDAWKNYWNEERLSKIKTLIAQTAPTADLVPDAFEPFFECATADYEPEPLYEAGLIPAGFQSTLMEKTFGGSYLCFTSVTCKMDTVRGNDTDYHRICDAIATNPNLMVLDTYYYTTDTLLQLNEDFNVLQWLSMAFVLIVLLVSFHFNLRHTLLGFMPILVSWLIVLGFMALFGMRFNLVNIIISTFIFGIGVDYSIFVMNGLIGGKENANLLAFHKTAIFFSAVVLIVTVASMLFAVHPAIQSVGFATLVGLVSAVVISYVVQPAIYNWKKNK